MTRASFQKQCLPLVLAASFLTPQMILAQGRPASFPIDIIIADGSNESDTGLKPTQPRPTLPGRDNNNNNKDNSNNNNSNNNNKSGNNNNNNNARPNTTTGGMKAATVSKEYSCSIFENSVHKDLLKSIDELSKVVSLSSECDGEPGAKGIKENGDKLKEQLMTLTAMMMAQDPSSLNPATVDQSVTGALSALGNLGDIFNNNSFLNSACGRQSMTTGKALLALNDLIAGFAPYALFAVSMNAALAPALPFVAAGAITTSGISALNKMMEKGTLDMTNATTRNAVLQNTCQYTKVARQVRFIQLAQSGRVDKITQELETEMKSDLYRANFNQPSDDLTQILAYKNAQEKFMSAVAKQLASDRDQLAAIDASISQSSDDILICTLSSELANWASDETSFPNSVFTNLDRSTAQDDRAQRLQALTLKSLHTTSLQKIQDLSQQASEDANALKSCGQVGRSWLKGISQAVLTTSKTLERNRLVLENELSQYSEYRTWKAQFDLIEKQKLTIKRVERAMEELKKNESIIDRSELAQRMASLKAGLFGTRSRKLWGANAIPVLEWVNHTKEVHDRALSAFIINMNALRSDSWSITEAARLEQALILSGGRMPVDLEKMQQGKDEQATLSNLTLEVLPVGSRNHELICQKLEAAWLNYAAAIDHLGAIKMYCDMIDDVLDSTMDQAVLTACRGQSTLAGRVSALSVVESARKVLTSKGFSSDAGIVKNKLDQLQCPMPAVSVMSK